MKITFLSIPLLCLLLVSGASAQSMRVNLVATQSVPASSEMAGYDTSGKDYEAQEVSATVLNTRLGINGTFVNNVVVIDPALADVDGAGPGTVGVVDWVEVQLRFVNEGDSTPLVRAAADRVAFKAGLLLSNGSIVDADSDLSDLLNAVLTFAGIAYDEATEDLYVAVNHRNHIPVLSNTPVVAASDGIYTYDFGIRGSEDLNVILSSGGSEVRAMKGGDTNDNGVIQGNDASNSVNPLIGRTGYISGDTNLNGVVQGNDASNLVNPSIGIALARFAY